MPPPICPAPTTRTSSNCIRTSLTGRGEGQPLKMPRSDLDEEGVALAAAGADRSEPEPAAVAAQLVDHRGEDSPARRADRMPEGDGAAVDVHLLRVGVEHLRGVEHHRREGLVQLDPLDVAA